MKITQKQLRSLVESVISEVVPPKNSSLKSRSLAQSAMDHPDIKEAIDTTIGAMSSALFEALGDLRGGVGSDDIALDESLHTDFHNDLQEFLERWVSTYIEQVNGS